MILFKRIALSVLLAGGLVMLTGCTEKSEAEKLKRYYSAVNAQVTETSPDLPGATPPNPALSPSGASALIVQGTPRIAKDGFCGDGIINGTTEDCDQGAIQNTACRDYGGIAGVVRCQANCLYDISDCMTPRADRDIGGLAETCKCNCDNSSCNGGCDNSVGAVGEAACQFFCDNECVCQCEGRLNAAVEDCRFDCACTVGTDGNPNCDCNLDQCELVVVVNPNIGTLVTTPVGILGGGRSTKSGS